MHNQWHVLVPRGAVIVQVVVVGKVAVVTSQLPMLHPKTLRQSSSNNSLRHASNNQRVNVQSGKRHDHAQKHRACDKNKM